MALSVTVTQYGKAENIAHTLSVGGSLDPSTTYYVRIYACDSISKILGAISDEYTFATTATEKTVNLTWDAVAGASYYAVLVTPYDPSVTARWYQRKIRGPGSSLYYSTTTNAFTYDGTASRYYNFHPFDLADDLPGGLDKDLGSCLITVNCGGGNTTPEDIHAAIGDTSISYLDKVNWCLRGSVEFDGVSNLVIEGRAIQCCGWFYWDTGDAGSAIRLGDSTFRMPCSLLHITHKFHRPQAQNGYLTAYGLRYTDAEWVFPPNAHGPCSPYSPIIKSGGMSGVGFNWFDALDMRGPVDISGSYFFGGISVAAGAGPDFVDFRDNGFYGLMDLVNGYSVILYDLTCDTPDNAPTIRRGNTLTASNEECARLVNFSLSQIATGIPVMYWYRTDPARPESERKRLGVKLLYELNITVTDKDGNPISGASVTIESATGDSNSYTTDGDGKITTHQVTFAWVFRNDQGTAGVFTDFAGDYTEVEYHTPHVVTVEADGFQAYQWTGDVSEAMTLEVAMIESASTVLYNGIETELLHSEIQSELVIEPIESELVISPIQSELVVDELESELQERDLQSTFDEE